MARKMALKTVWRKGAAWLLCLLLLLSMGGVAYAQAEVPLKDYAASVHATLKVNKEGTELPQYVENGQKLFFDLQISGFDSQKLVTYLKSNPEADFTIPLDFTGHIDGNYPAEINPEDFDNVALVDNEPLFRWWIDETNDVIRIRFDQNWIDKAGSNTVMENVSLGFDGTLNVVDKGSDGRVVFNAAGEAFPLQMKTGYELAKSASVPYYSTDASSYLVDYSVTLTLDQNMKLSATAESDKYCAALTLVDTVEADGALQGEILDVITVVSPEGENVAVTKVNSGTENTLTISSSDQMLQKGSYTFVYKMKVKPEAASAKLTGYTDVQKTNTVELKENGASLKIPLTATATMAWDEVTENQFKIDKNAFTEKAPDFKGVYLDEDSDNYYIDFRVVVYIREPVSTFTVTDHPNYSLSFRTAPAAPSLEGVDTSADYWNNDISTAVLTTANATVTSAINASGENVVTITAPDGQMLQPGAYHLRVPADVTSAVDTTLQNSYPQSYSNTAYLTSVDGRPTGESKEFKQAIPNRTEPRKDGGYEVNTQTGELLFYNGKPVIRWDVWFGWDFYDKTTFVDTLAGMELLVNSEYPFEIHSFTDQNHHKERLASLTSVSDTSYLDFNADGEGFSFTNANLDTNADGSPVKLYKLVYFSTPLDADNELGYVNTGLKNNYVITHTTPSGDGFGTGPIRGEVEPNLTSNGRLYVSKKHVIERTDSLTQWKITCSNTQNKIPFTRLDNLDIVDLVPRGQTPIGEVTIHYSDDWPITVEMLCENNKTIQLAEGIHYNIVKQLEGFDFGEDGKYGFAVDLNMEAVAAVLAEQNSVYFQSIDVQCYLNNETHAPGQNYRIKNDGWLNYTNQGVALMDGINAYYDRGFATKRKEAPAYGDYYDPTAGRNFTVCTVNGNSAQAFSGGYDDNPANGDGNEEILWKIFIGAREFGNDPDPITVTVTDTLSDNQMFPSYPGKSLKELFLIEAEDKPGYIILPDSVVLNGSTFTLTFTVPGGGWAGGNKDVSKDVYITYHTVLKPEAIQDALDAASVADSTIVLDYSNTATIGWNGESYTLPISTGSKSFDASMMDKTGKFLESSGSKVNYTIEMNPLGLDLAKDSDVILLEDSMGDGKDVFAYVASSFKVTNLETGAQMSASSVASATTYVLTMAEDGKSFKLDVPDNTPMKLTYQVKTTQPVGTKDVTLVNNASLAGRKPQAESITFDVSSSYQSGSFSVRPDEAGIRLVKTSSEGADSDSPTFLSGAEFTVTTLESDYKPGESEKKTANANGVIEIKKKIEAVTILVIEETKAPDGYRLGTAPWKWCYALLPAGGDFSDVEMAELKAAVGCDVTTIPAGSYVEDSITNDPISFTVRKVDETGNLLDGATLVLKNANGITIDPDSHHNVPGEWKFTQLTTGSYTLSEDTAPNGYVQSAESPWEFTLDENGNIKTEQIYNDLSISTDGAYLTIANRPVPENISVTANKAWENADGTTTAPAGAAVVFTLLADGTATDYTVVLDGTADNAPTAGGYESEAWQATFVNLPKTDSATGEDIVYTVAETADCVGYAADPTDPVADGGTITNRPEMADISVEKRWLNGDGTTDPPEDAEVELVLYADGEQLPYVIRLDGVADEKPASGGYESAPWVATVPNLPVYKEVYLEEGITTFEPIYYFFDETERYPGYLPEYDPENGVLTNKFDTTLHIVLDARKTINGVPAREDEVFGFGTSLVKMPEGYNQADGYASGTGHTMNKGEKIELDFSFYEEAIGQSFLFEIKELYNIMTDDSDRERYHWLYAQDDTKYYLHVDVLPDGDNDFRPDLNMWFADENDNRLDPQPSGIVFNNRKRIGITAEKEWLNIDGTTTPPENAKVTLTLFQQLGEGEATATEYHVVLDGEADDAPAEYNYVGGYESEPWKVSFVGLPSYGKVNDEGEWIKITYTVAETEGHTGYTATPADPVEDGGMITNTQDSGSLRITKTFSGQPADADLSGLSFTINDGTKDTIVTYADFTDGAYIIRDIPVGTEYTVTETNADTLIANYTLAAESMTEGSATIVKDETVTIALSNTYTQDVGSLRITKTFSGQPADADLSGLSFTINDGTKDTIVTYADFTDGAYIIRDIPVGTEYTVTETNADTLIANYTLAAESVTEGSATIVKDETVTIALSNTYTYKASGALSLSAAKTVNAAEPREDQVFTFELLDAADNVLQTTQNTLGEIAFNEIAYTEADIGKSFLYKVQEKQEAMAGYTLDNTVYAVAVWVADNGDGTLKVTKAISSDGESKEAITFDNAYKAQGEWKPEAIKTVNGIEPREDQVYEFALTDQDGNVILAENEKGKISFGTLFYDQTDAGKTYTYTVQETAASTELLAKDQSIYTVDVTVTDNKDGTLDVKPVITKSGEIVEEISFANTLYAPLTISKTVEGVETAETFPFTVKLYHADGTEAAGGYVYTGDAEGEIRSGDDIVLAHGQSVTITGLLPGMKYSVTEAAAAAFDTMVNGNAGNSIEGTLSENANEVSFVNKFKTTMFMVKKSWQGGGGGAIELTLYANGEKVEPQPAYSRDENVYVYADLPMYDEQDQIIVYSAEERYVDGFLTIYSNVAPYADETNAIYDGGTIINKAIVKADFAVKKEWSGLAEDETAPTIELVLYCNGVATEYKTPEPDRNGWYKYYDLPGEVDGMPAVYTVKEIPVEGYETSYELADGTSAEYADNGGTITNAKIPQTGDKASLTLWMTLMGASVTMLMLLLKRRKA